MKKRLTQSMAGVTLIGGAVSLIPGLAAEFSANTGVADGCLALDNSQSSDR